MRRAIIAPSVITNSSLVPFYLDRSGFRDVGLLVKRRGNAFRSTWNICGGSIGRVICLRADCVDIRFRHFSLRSTVRETVKGSSKPVVTSFFPFARASLNSLHHHRSSSSPISKTERHGVSRYARPSFVQAGGAYQCAQLFLPDFPSIGA